MSITTHMTYTGSCTFTDTSLASGATTFLCSNMSSNLDQKMLFFDHILGLRDVSAPSATLTSNVAGTKKNESTTATGNIQKRIFRYSPAVARASFAGPVPVENFDKILTAAIEGSNVEVEMVYWKNGPSAKVGKAKIESLSIDLKAGEIATFSVGLVGAEYTFETSANSQTADCQKLLTWDNCTVAATPVTSAISSFQITINNPLIPIYTTKWSSTTDASGGLMPQKIRIGMQEVSGAIGIYGPDTIDTPSLGTVKFALHTLTKTIQAAFVQPKDDGSGGLYVRTILFTGVNDADIWL